MPTANGYYALFLLLISAQIHNLDKLKKGTLY